VNPKDDKPVLCHDPLPEAPKGWHLHDALKATVDENKHYHCGKLEFENQKMYREFVQSQLAIGGTPQQMATLYAVETTGKPPNMDPVKPAPPGTTADTLLDVSDKKPDSAGFYHLGTLRVQKDEFKQFEALQKDICAKNPEALDTLYHMEHAPQPVTFRVTKDSDRNDRFDPNTNTIYWNPHTAVRDGGETKGRVPAATAALHEETHWAIRGPVGDTLGGIPDKHYSDWNEKAVMDGAETRDLALRGLPPRTTHNSGHILATDHIDSVSPSLTMTQNGKEREVKAPFSQSGRVIDVDDKKGTTTIAVRGDGKEPEHRMEFKTEQLNLAMGDKPHQTHVLLEGAKKHGDTVNLQITGDGRVIYSNPAQEQRLADHPEPGVKFPKPMEPVAMAPAKEPSLVGGDRGR
jgi:hypothetical protein